MRRVAAAELVIEDDGDVVGCCGEVGEGKEIVVRDSGAAVEDDEGASGGLEGSIDGVPCLAGFVGGRDGEVEVAGCWSWSRHFWGFWEGDGCGVYGGWEGYEEVDGTKGANLVWRPMVRYMCQREVEHLPKWTMGAAADGGVCDMETPLREHHPYLVRRDCAKTRSALAGTTECFHSNIQIFENHTTESHQSSKRVKQFQSQGFENKDTLEVALNT